MSHPLLIREAVFGDAAAGRAVYVGGKDPVSSGFRYCVFEDHRLRLEIAGVFHLVELAPSESLYRGISACAIIQRALDRGELQGRRRRDLMAWLEAAPSDTAKLARENAITSAIGFLDGRPLAEAREAFADQYYVELGDGVAWPALAWLWSITLSEEVTLLDERPGFLGPVIRRRLATFDPVSELAVVQQSIEPPARIVEEARA